MEGNTRVFIRMLARAYRYEDAEQEIISQALLEITNTIVWDVMFDLMKDNEIHKKLIESMVEDMGINLDEFKEYSTRNIEIKSFNFSDDLAIEILSELLKYEFWAKNYYEHMVNLADLMISHEMSDDIIRNVKTTLENLVEWENTHIKKIRETMQKI